LQLVEVVVQVVLRMVHRDLVAAVVNLVQVVVVVAEEPLVVKVAQTVEVGMHQAVMLQVVVVAVVDIVVVTTVTQLTKMVVVAEVAAVVQTSVLLQLQQVGLHNLLAHTTTVMVEQAETKVVVQLVH
jgi:hypothetical protein